MRHNHHLIPRHLGGTNDPSNIVRDISITRHAMFHFANWQLWKSQGDYIAFKALSGCIGKEQIIELVLSYAGKKGGIAARDSGQLKRASSKQPRKTRQKIGKKLSKWNSSNPGKNKRNSGSEVLNSYELQRIFEIHQVITQRKIGEKLGSVVISTGVNYTQAAEIIKAGYGIDVDASKLASICTGKRILHRGVKCLTSMAISSQATNALVEGSETTGGTKRGS